MANLPTVYDFYTSGGISSGLSVDQPYFTLNDRNVSLYSGALHYWRVHPDQWRDRLRKIRAAGLNAVETYIPWALHEPAPGVYDFGAGGSEFQELLNVERFLNTAQEEDLLAIIRVGPFISAEFEFGGFPSWFLREKSIRLRRSDSVYMGFVERWFKALFAVLTALQFTKGGPIIMFQIENEYGNTGIKDFAYLQSLRTYMEDNGVVELMFTTDSPARGKDGAIPGVFQTANFGNYPEDHLNTMLEIQPNKPLMVMEYWTGWFDAWTESHHTKGSGGMMRELEVVMSYSASFNLYMFEGGTNFRFTSGGSTASNAALEPFTSSYDYDAPLSEGGDYTQKYYGILDLINTHSPMKFKTPDVPELIPKAKYADLEIVGQLYVSDLIDQSELLPSPGLISMENLDFNDGGGQGYGYIAYRKTNLNISANAVLRVGGHVCDSLMVLVNGELKSPILRTTADLNGFGWWKLANGILNLGSEEYVGATLDLVVGNMGRGHNVLQPKGLFEGNVSINGNVLTDWLIAPMEFNKDWNNGLTGWRQPTLGPGPSLYKAILEVTDPYDTFIDMREWTHGFTAVNGFVISRHMKFGPQQTEYLPAPLLKRGQNEILIFEHFTPSNLVKFSAEPIWQTHQ